MDTMNLSWNELNAVVRKATENTCNALLLSERKPGRRRRQYLLRIHSRLNKVRADRERAELRKVSK